MNTAILRTPEIRHVWFGELDAKSHSWISVLTRGGIDGFVNWVSGSAFSFESIFDPAPRALTGCIPLRQTVDLVRITTDVVEEQIQLLLPHADRQPLLLGIVHHSREIAFVATAVYVRAAEARGAWDSRIEATIIDTVARAEVDESVTSRASTLGWNSEVPTVVVIANAPRNLRIDELRRASTRLSLDMLAVPQRECLVCTFAGEVLIDPARTCDLATELEPHFVSGPVVIGPLAEGLCGALTSARSTASGYRAARAWPEGPRTLLSNDLLPEWALAGDGHARRTLARDLFGPLKGSKELLETCVGFLDAGSSMEAIARAMSIHPNTVRYRLRWTREVTEYDPTDVREAYVLRLAITLGRLQERTYSSLSPGSGLVGIPQPLLSRFRHPRSRTHRRRKGRVGGVLAIVTPGQGAQTLGFLVVWLEEPSFRTRLEWLSAAADTDLMTHGTTSDAEIIRDTAVAQPLLAASAPATAKQLSPAVIGLADVVTGHSVGEFVAAAMAGVVSVGSAMVLVRERGRGMAEASAVMPTSMTATIGRDRGEVLVAIEAAGLTPANNNGSGQIVVTGTKEQLTALADSVPRRARLIPFSVTGAFHTRHMAPAMTRLGALAAAVPIEDPRTGLLNDADGAVVTSGREYLERLVRQVANSVRWGPCMETMSGLGATGTFELVPAGALTGIAKRSLKGVELSNLNTPDQLDEARSFCETHLTRV